MTSPTIRILHMYETIKGFLANAMRRERPDASMSEGNFIGYEAFPSGRQHHTGKCRSGNDVPCCGKLRKQDKKEP